MLVALAWVLAIDVAWWVSPVCSLLIVVCEFIALNAYDGLVKRVEKLEKKCNERDGADNG